MFPVTKCKRCNKINYVDIYCDNCGGELKLIIKENEPDKIINEVVNGITEQIKEGAEIARKEADNDGET